MDLARVLRRSWPIVVALALLGGVGAGVLAERREPVYRAQTRLLVTFAADGSAAPQPPPSEEVADQLMQRRVKTYATMMNTPRLTRPVIDSLRLPYPPDDLTDRVVAWSTVDTLTIDVAVTDRRADTAAAIANALAAELRRIARRDLPPAGLGLKAHVAVATPAVPPRRPERVWWPPYAAAGALGGLAIGLALARARENGRAGTPIGADARAVWTAARAAVRRRPVGPEPADGPAPDGPAPDGPAPDGPAPDGPAPDGPAPDGPEQDDAAQDDGPASRSAVKERQVS
ncbi:lipopolysaccharide biosynthesis protein [Micromonospora sp. WMMD998]|uniref:lipopolysaccharide biosynthesis protein n=1 Tax=Micromonospora sp. WMMD998 TaxID=3016092 RepID=UPI00249BDD17|nr:lipopolysaccharide biosynthesis protein [Micromonospora sp. WMMD998]WFE38720.1 lipopolysaccharide biosynthesis protein [Micromonospora sp. WMMD998]